MILTLFLLMATPPWSLNLQTSPSFKHDMRITYLVRSRWVELVLQHEEMEGERTRERERVRGSEEVSVEDEENGRGSICEAAGGNWGLRAGQDQQISDLQFF